MRSLLDFLFIIFSMFVFTIVSIGLTSLGLNFDSPLHIIVLVLVIVIVIVILILFAAYNRIISTDTRNSWLGTQRNYYFNEAMNSYENRITKYYKKHPYRFELQNENVFLKTYNCGTELVSFYCVNKKSTAGSLERLIFSSSNSIHINAQEIMIFWLILDMEFKDDTTFQDIIDLSRSLGTYRFHQLRKKVKIIECNHYDISFILQQNPYLCFYKKQAKPQKHKRRKKKVIIEEPNEYFTVKADIEILFDIYHTINKNLYDKKYWSMEYKEIYNLLSQRTDCKIESSLHTKKTVSQSNIIDINNASEAELSKLPGINVILAKRIIQQREFIDGFKSKEEFFDFCGLKPHFMQQIEPIITVGEFDMIDTIFQRIERTVDTMDDEDIDENIQSNDNDDIIVDF